MTSFQISFFDVKYDNNQQFRFGKKFFSLIYINICFFLIFTYFRVVKLWHFQTEQSHTTGYKTMPYYFVKLKFWSMKKGQICSITKVWKVYNFEISLYFMVSLHNNSLSMDKKCNGDKTLMSASWVVCKTIGQYLHGGCL